MVTGEPQATRCKRLGLILFAALSCSVCASAAAQQNASLPAVINFLLDDDAVTTPGGPVFGAKRVSEADRPTRGWLMVFDDLVPVPLTGSLQDAIDNCAISGCVIEIDQLNLADTVFINRSNIKLLGKNGNRVTFSSTDSVFHVETGSTNIVFEKLNIDGRVSGNSIERDPSVYGIYLLGNTIRNVLIKDNHIHHLDGKEGAHGIAVLGEGDSEQNAISNVSIEGNLLNDLRTGFSESLVINGNVKNWEIINNQVVDVNNIAIDAIGGEGTSPTQTVNGRILPGLVDAARLGFIQNNRVTNMSTISNPAYNQQHSYAAGIYIDGGRDIIVSGNVITNTPWAFEVGAENCVQTSNISIDNNQALGSRFGDLIIGGCAAGGYLTDQAINCNPNTSSDDAEGHGYVGNTTITNNSFVSNPVSVNLIELSKRVINTIVAQAGVIAVNTDGVVTGDGNSIRTSE
jgi:hypothetical protein